MISDVSRRSFLQRASALSIAGAATPFVLNLAAIGEAAAATASDYKAIVCVFLYGGNDYANTLIPADTTNYNLYNAQRSALAHSQASLAGTTLAPTVPLATTARRLILARARRACRAGTACCQSRRALPLRAHRALAAPPTRCPARRASAAHRARPATRRVY